MDYIGKSRIIKAIMTLIIMGTMLALTDDLIFSLIILNFSWIVIFFIYDRRKLKLFLSNVRPSFSLNIFKQLFFLAFPLGLVVMLNSLNTNLPRIIVERILGEELLGYFASIVYLITAGNTFIQAVGQAAAPRLAKLFSIGNIQKFIRILGCLLLIGVIISLLGILISTLFGELILTLLYDRSYAKYNNILILVMISGIFSFSRSALGYGLTAMRYFKIQPYINIAGLIIMLFMSLTLIPRFGLNGAGYTLIIGSMVQFILYFIVIAYQLNKHWKTNI